MKELIEKNIINLDIKDFSLEKKLKLKSLIIMYLIMTRDDNNIDNLSNILIELLKKDKNYRVNNESYINILIKFALTEGFDSKTIINNYINKGYYYHSTNGAFLKSISNTGLILKNKPWDLKELELIKNIFSKRNKKDIFGLYQGEENTPIYLASSLASSSYYAISSPTWFLHFVSGGMKNSTYDREAYRNRDYDACLKNVSNLINEYKLDNEESKIVIEFFNKYYNILGLNKEPILLLIKRDYIDKEPINTNKKSDETQFEYIKRTLNEYCSRNIMLKENINKEDIIIINYFNKKKYLKNK